MIDITKDPTEANRINGEIIKRQERIQELKRGLDDTDYRVQKQMEATLNGEELPYTAEEFKTYSDERQAMRDEIDTLLEEIPLLQEQLETELEKLNN